ncbi:MAG: hypothetical protein RR998_07260, partial [Oscillospiraceae bacterium]
YFKSALGFTFFQQPTETPAPARFPFSNILLFALVFPVFLLDDLWIAVLHGAVLFQGVIHPGFESHNG